MARDARARRGEAPRCATLGGLLTKRADDLITLTRDTEKEFLDVGGTLLGLQQCVSELFAGATSAARSLASTDSTSPLSAAWAVLSESDTRFRDCQDVLVAACATWLRIDQRIRGLIALATGFKTLAATLRGLHVFLRIESSRTQSLREECAALIVHAGNVTTQIANEMGLFVEKASHIHGICESSQQLLEQSRDQFNKQREAHRGVAEDAMNELDMLFVASAGAIEVLSDGLAKFRSRVGDLVASLQFHDIARQQLEHVADALRCIAAEPACAARGVSAPPTETHILGSMLVQQWQLRNVASGIDQTAQSIRNSLSEVSETLKSQAQDVDALMASRLDESGNIERLGKALTASSVSLEGISQLSASALRMVDELTVISEQMGGCIRSTESGAIKIHTLALNAQISAARLGDEGRTIDVISMEMGRLSAMVAAETGLVTTEWKAIAEEVLSLQNLLGARMAEVGAKGRKLSIEASSIPQAIYSRASMVQENSRISVQKTAGLRAEIARTLSGIYFDQSARPLFQELESELNGMLKDADVASLEKHLEEQKASKTGQADRYTMERERQVHRAAIQCEADAPPDALPEPAPAKAAAPAAPDQEFGDNVELF
jgi:uncharacterized phage infection (PIP) family protein YhgE